MSKRLLRGKRALTPVLSSLLLTVLAVAAMAIATSATYMITANLKDNMSERVVVEDVWFTGGAIKVHLLNVGKVSIHVSAVYVNHASQSFNSPFHLGLDQHRDLEIYYAWGTGETYYIDIVTSRGTHIASYYKAP
ncbi:MAG: hypothetical protein NWE94_06275 [Candidatus Bathyarchaeota archaeon]|nr:hypothetical protein [Candidatus Bathyarchaeota archaeon]